MEENKTEPLIVALARDIATSFPELEGRALAVSEVDPFTDKTHIPSLPLCYVGMVSERGSQPSSGGGRISLSQDIAVEFMFEPAKYKRKDGMDTPFYAYYDYEGVRDRLLSLTHKWRTPRNGGLSFRGGEMESNQYAVSISFRFAAEEQWCAPKQEVPRPVQVVARVLQGKSQDPCCEPCEEEVDPCDFARNRD